MTTDANTKSASKEKKRKNAWKNLPDVWALMKPRRGLLILGFLLMAVGRVSGLVLPASTKYFVDNVILHRQVGLLTPLALAVLGATIIQGLTSFTLTQLLSKSAQRMITELRRQVQAHIGRLPIAFYDANKTGVLVSRIMSDVEGVRNLIGTGLVEFVGGLMTAAIALVYLIHTSVLMTGVAFSILVVFGFGISWAFKTIRPIFRARPKINAEVTGRLTESLSGVRVVKGYHAEEREEKVFSTGVQRLLDNVLKTLTATSLMSLSGAMLLGIVSVLMMELGGRKMLAGTMTPGQWFAYSAFLAFLIAPVFQIVAIGTQITEAITGLERTREILNEQMEDEAAGRTATLDRVNGLVEARDVSFAYEERKEVLHDIGFASQPGTVTALVGPSGAGKSTIIGLIAAFYVPSSGKMLVDGVDLATVKLSSYRTQLGVVLQAACRIARVDEFAESFEQKYDTVVGERGVKLSGGQKQRVSIARAILADPRILILDEATSSLDSESEALIQEGLKYLMRGRTTFVIAHRLSTIRRADQILVVEGGRIIERGTHETLYALGGRYYDLYTKQHAVETNLFLAPGESTALDESAAESASGGNGRGGAAVPDAIRILRGQSS